MKNAIAQIVIASIAFALLTANVTRADDAPRVSKQEKKLVIFIAGKPSHGFAQHEANAGCELLAKCLHEGMPSIETKVYHNGWPTESNALDGASAIVMFCDGGGGHMVLPHLKEVDELAKKGVGIGCIHYAVEVNKDQAGTEFLNWIGGYFEPFWSINPVWHAEMIDLPVHPVTSGVKPFKTLDEWYYHMRFRPDMKDVTPILAAVPPPGLKGTDPGHNGTPEIHEPNRHVPEALLWVAENPDEHQRGFGCTGGHYHFNWGNDNFRKTVLNSIAWIAHAEVPKDGVPVTPLTADDLIANLDKKQVPADFSKEKLQKQIDEMNGR